MFIDGWSEPTLPVACPPRRNLTRSNEFDKAKLDRPRCSSLLLPPDRPHHRAGRLAFTVGAGNTAEAWLNRDCLVPSAL
jgi:hypothetical protein